MSDSEKKAVTDPASLVHRQMVFGWWTLLVSLSLGILLEALHAFKAGFYLNVSNETRRLMWTLAHAHGTLLGLVNIAFGITLKLQNPAPASWQAVASNSLLAATVLIPTGFFLGGIAFYGGDPGLGILLLPLGAVFLLMGVFLTARGLQRGPDRSGSATAAAAIKPAAPPAKGGVKR
jgi:hypothetical protein